MPITPELVAALRTEIEGWGVSPVIIGPMSHRDEAVALYQEVLGTPPQEIAGVEIWRLESVATPGA